MKIYIAGSYSRRLEFCEYRAQLQAMGHAVTSRWLDGQHQIANDGTPIGDNGEALVESGDEDGSALRQKFALDDLDDLLDADCIINFTEPPRSSVNRGGRHVEFGVALGIGVPHVIVVGYRENLFHWLADVDFYADWESCKKAMEGVEK